MSAVLAAGGCAGGPTAEFGRSTPLTTPPELAQASHVQAAIIPLGTVPYDNLSLPIASPDGRFIATQTGAPPTWPTVLAEHGATVPEATRIEIYRLDRQLGQTVHHVTIDEPLLLGRSCDTNGFLVESARPDGARWIGYANWSDGSLQWLVADEHVNAFASMGPQGRLAWSRRAQDADHFDLVIRGGGQEWTLGSQGGDWLVPAWSGRGDGLFALRLVSGSLSASYMTATDPTSIRQSLRQLPLAQRATVHHAYQATTGQVVVADRPPPAPEVFVFFHPVQRRMALWRPISAQPMTTFLLQRQSSAAVVSGPQHVLVATADKLIVQNLADLRGRQELLAGFQVPRQVASPEWPYVLMSPIEDRIALIAMRLLERGEPLPR